MVPEASKKQNASIHRCEVMLPEAAGKQVKARRTAHKAHHMAYMCSIGTTPSPYSRTQYTRKLEIEK